MCCYCVYCHPLHLLFLALLILYRTDAAYCVCCHRKILSADAEAAAQESVRDEGTEEEKRESNVSEGCTGDSTNSSSQKHDNSVESVANGHEPTVLGTKDLESTMLDTKDNTSDDVEASTAVSKTDVDGVCGDNLTSDAADDTHSATQCSADVSAVESNIDDKSTDVMQSSPNEKYNADAETQSSAAVCDCSEHRTEADSEAKLERTDCTSSDEGRDCLQSKEPHLSLDHGSNDKIGAESATDAQPDLSPTLMNEVDRH